MTNRDERGQESAQLQVARLRKERQRLDPVADLERMGRLHLELTFAYREAGNEVGARKAYPRALDYARKAKNLPLQIHLLRMARMFLEPDTARRHIQYAVELARETGLDLEEAMCLNNMGVVAAELTENEAAAAHWHACLGILTSRALPVASVPLNNLGFLSLAQGELDDAGTLLGNALRLATEPSLASMVRANLAVVVARRGLAADAVLELRALRRGAPCRQIVRASVAFNLARALLEVDLGEEALEAAVEPPPWQANDEELARAALANLRLQIYRRLGQAPRPPDRDLRQRAKLLEVTTKPQVWLYRNPWARGDIQFFSEPTAQQ